MDGSSDRWGLFSGYYYFDDYDLNNPYPTGQGGASVPGFAALNLGAVAAHQSWRYQDVRRPTVNELRLSYMRNANNVGSTRRRRRPEPRFAGLCDRAGHPGIVVLAPKIEGIENVSFNSFVMGTPITNLTQANNTFALNDNFSKVLGRHTHKAGVQVSYEQVNVNPNPHLQRIVSISTVRKPAPISRTF